MKGLDTDTRQRTIVIAIEKSCYSPCHPSSHVSSPLPHSELKLSDFSSPSMSFHLHHQGLPHLPLTSRLMPSCVLPRLHCQNKIFLHITPNKLLLAHPARACYSFST